MLDVDRGVDVDPGGQEFLHVLPALLVPRAGGVGVGQLVHQGDLGLARQHRVDVHLLELHPHVFDLRLGEDLQPRQERIGLEPAVGLHVGRHHVPLLQFPLPRRLQHGIGLPDPGGVAEEYLQLPPSFFRFFGLGTASAGLQERGVFRRYRSSSLQVLSKASRISFRGNFINMFVNKELILGREPLEQVDRTIRILKPEVVGI